MVTVAKGLSKEVTTFISYKFILLKATDENLKTVPLNIYADYNPFKILHTKKS